MQPCCQALSLRPPSEESAELLAGVRRLAAGQVIVRERRETLGIALVDQRLQVLVVEDKVRALVEAGQRLEGTIECDGSFVGLRVALRGSAGQAHEFDDGVGQHVADTGYDPRSATVHQPVNYLGVHPDDERQFGVAASDVFRRVGQGLGATELLVSDQTT